MGPCTEEGGPVSLDLWASRLVASSTSPSSSGAAMSRLPPLLRTPPASLKLRGTDAVESRAPKRRPVEPPRPTTSGSRHRYASLYSASSRRREENPPSSSRRRAGRPPPPPPPSKVRRRARSPSYISITQRLAELQRAKRPRRGEVDAAEAAVDDREEGKMAGSSLRDESFVTKRPSHSHYNCKHPETSSAAVEERLNPPIRGDGQKLDNEKMNGKNQNDHKAPSRSARRKKIKRQIWAEAKKEMREMKKDKLLEKIKKLQACVWLLEKEGADMAEIMEFRSLLESAKKQYVENEAQSAKEGSSASHQGLNNDKHEKMHVETMAAPIEKVDPMISKDWQNLDDLKIQKYHEVETSSVEKVDHMIERDEKNMDSGKAEGRSLKGCKAVSEQSELAEEVNYLTSELELIRQDRDYQLAQVQSLMTDIGKQKEIARRCGVELENAMRRVSALEEGCLLQRETISTLQIQLASLNEKLTVSSSTKDSC